MMSGINTTQYLCQLLKVKYLGFSAMTELAFRGSWQGNTTIFSTHGCGGAKHVHSDVSKLERDIMPFWDADIFIRGHSTKVFVVHGHPLTKLSLGKDGALHLQDKKRLLVNTGGFMDGYSEGH